MQQGFGPDAFSSTIVFCDATILRCRASQYNLMPTENDLTNAVSQIVFDLVEQQQQWPESKPIQNVSIEWKQSNIYCASLFDQPVNQLASPSKGIYVECTIRVPSRLEFVVLQESNVSRMIFGINNIDFLRVLASHDVLVTLQ